MKTAYINGILLDGTADMTPQEDLVVLTDADTIEDIEFRDNVDLSGYRIVDLDGKYLMPGLINLHVHLPATGKPKKKQPDNVKLVKLMTSNPVLEWIIHRICEETAKTELMSGVTTIRTVGGIEDTDSMLRDRIAAGNTVGPRIIACNQAVSVPGGHMAGSLGYIAHTPEEAVGYVRKIAAQKPDLIKLMITGGVMDATVRGEPGELKMPPEMIRAACDEAHRLGMKVAAHVESPEGIKAALKNGVDSIEHGAVPDAEIIELFKKNDAILVTTLSPAMPYSLFDPQISHVTELEQYNGTVVFTGIIACAKACLEQGISVGLGTDTGVPYVTHYDMWRELYYFHKFCGVTNQFALHTATQKNAELAGIGDVTGTLEAGKSADMIVTEQNPLYDLRALRNIDMVVVRGRLISHPKVRKYGQAEKQLDMVL